MKTVVCLWLVFLLSAAHSLAQTVVVAHPVSDATGFAAFQIDHVLRTEGKWQYPPEPGQLLYPYPYARAYPLARFGESVIITLPIAGNYGVWQGMHVHHGYIPALQGRDLKSALQAISSVPLPPTDKTAPQGKYMVCPICGRAHIRI
jgi:hypothetical protein